jgi:hypothetical protein
MQVPCLAALLTVYQVNFVFSGLQTADELP